MGVKVTLNNRALNLLEQLPIEIQGRVGAKAVTSAARIVRKALKSSIPDSRKTGTPDKWSKATAKKYASDKPMRMSIKVYNRFRKGSVGGLVWVPALAWREFGFVNQLWGRSNNSMRIPADPKFRPAIDATRRAQQTAIVKVITREFRKLAERAK